MKKIIYISLILLSVLSACTKEEFEPISNISGNWLIIAKQFNSDSEFPSDVTLTQNSDGTITGMFEYVFPITGYIHNSNLITFTFTTYSCTIRYEGQINSEHEMVGHCFVDQQCIGYWTATK